VVWTYIKTLAIMPFTALQKQERRAAKAKAEGKTYKPRVKPPHSLPLKSSRVLTIPETVPIEQELNRSRMEAEDLRGHIWRMSTTSIICNNPLYPGRDIRLQPICKKMLGIKGDPKFYLTRKHSSGNWLVAQREGIYKNKELWCEIPEEMFC